ncbi:MAG: 30S ribosome-binding factor RbfA [Clostridia bacterium]|nr:30S ribosome-binding factor RbfA [Clostridia bacterium]
MKIRIERVNGELQRQIAKVIANDIKDPRLQGALVSVTKVHTTPDLKYAKVHLSIYADSDEKKKEAFDTVVRSRAFIRNKMKDAVQIRLLPELNFVIDNSVDYGMHIDKILSTMVIPPAEENDN